MLERSVKKDQSIVKEKRYNMEKRLILTEVPDRIRVITSENNPSLAKKIQIASREVMMRNRKLYKELEHK